MSEPAFSIKQLAAVLDNAPSAIYVSALDNFELLYANRLAEKLFRSQPASKGAACHSMAGFDQPCPFCHVAEMSEDKLLVREFTREATGRTYQLSGKIIDWAGRPAHIEYVLDVTDQKRQERQNQVWQKRLDATFSSVPCGLCVYRYSEGRILPMFHNPAFYQIMGYSAEHIQQLEQQTDFLGVHPQDTEGLKAAIQESIRNDGLVRQTYRLFNDREQEYRWIHLEGAVKPQPDGTKLLYAVYSDVSDRQRLSEALEAANEKTQDIIKAIPGAIASYQVVEGRFIPDFYSEGVETISGYTPAECRQMADGNMLEPVYAPDRVRVHQAAQAALRSGEPLDVSYRMRHKNGSLFWVHLNGRRAGPLGKVSRFYAVFTGMSAETRLFQSMADDSADGIYVIDRNSYDLLYINEAENLFAKEADGVGKKCYAALHGQNAPCQFCTLKTHPADGKEHEMAVDGTSFYSTRFRETDWNGIPAYIKHVRDITQEVTTRREKERLEEYFQTVVKYLPGGVAVVRYEKDGSMTPEFLSAGFAAMTGMSLEEAWTLYKQDAMAGVYPKDRKAVDEQMAAYIASGDSHCEIVYRLKKGDGGYVWVKNTLSLIQNEGGESRVYAMYHDMTREREEKEALRRQYNEMLLQHYRESDPNALIIGHCNITQNRILEIIDHTGSDLIKTFGTVRESFFTGLASLVAEPAQRQTFLNTYLNAPALAAFARKDTEQILNCFVKLPRETHGRYVQFKVDLVETPDTGDITGILTVTDTTEQTISDRILHQLSMTSYDFVIDLDLEKDRYTVVAQSRELSGMPPQGCHSAWVRKMAASRLVPRHREQYVQGLEIEEIRRRLGQNGAYTISFSAADENGEIRTKNMTVSPVDLRLGRVCLVRTDITDSVREQQGLLNMMAYAFELMGFIDLHTNQFTMYDRQTVLQNLAPYVVDDYDTAVGGFAEFYGSDENKDEAKNQFCVSTLVRRLTEKPAGYDFVFPYTKDKGAPRYKQINVLWGDENHSTICLVRADVTDMLAAERRSKKELEGALALAKEANRAKSDFLSAMSHDIRTPMNAIMGMTTLAAAHLDDRARVADCLHKISLSSGHLLSLINDILDMSKIERSKVTLNLGKVSLTELIEQLSSMIAPQAKAAGLRFCLHTENLQCRYFYGDRLRINQILLNLLSNAVKFTPEGGEVEFWVEQLPAQEGRVRYRFTVRDTGMGMPPEFLEHVFEPFTRSNRSNQVEGTGLGLSITKGLVDLMKGEVTVESAPGKGSTFRVELEAEAAQPSEAELKAEAETPISPLQREKLFAGRRFLVAEDNAINAEILCELLQMYGAGSDLRTDGRQAVQAFGKAAPGVYDAVLMDIQMPGMNGYEAARAIRGLARPDAKSIPIIAMTANAFAEDVQAALDAGMNAHVAKPIDLELLRATLSRVLAGSGS